MPGPRIGTGVGLVVVALAISSPSAARADGLRPATEIEDVVATCRSPNNGAGPFWSYGSPMIVRVGDRVFAGVMETGEGVPLLCNTRWRLFRRDDDGWKDVLHPSEFREREPCPLATTGPDRLLLSANPSTQPPGTKYGPCEPTLMAIDPRDPGATPLKLAPGWPADATFTDHSYRGLAADGRRGEALVLNIDARTSAQYWAFMEADGRFARRGAIEFPIRSCYPQVALRDRAAHVLAIGDIVEPNEAWRAYKKEQTGAAWDYVFRRLFYARNPDVAGGDFEPPTEVDSVDATGGHIANLDLWIDAAGNARVLYLKTTGTPILRDRFFPGEPIAATLECATIENGRVVRGEPIVVGGEGRSETPVYARFHATSDGSLYVIDATRVTTADGGVRLENRIRRLLPTRESVPTRLDLNRPFGMFFTATERGGSAPSDVLDMIGPNGEEIRHARVRLVRAKTP